MTLLAVSGNKEAAKFDLGEPLHFSWFSNSVRPRDNILVRSWHGFNSLRNFSAAMCKGIYGVRIPLSQFVRFFPYAFNVSVSSG